MIDKKITGKIEIIESSNGQLYLAAAIDEKSLKEFNKFVQAILPAEFIQNQQKRDKDSHHVTIFGAAPFGHLRKNENKTFSDIIRSYEGKNISFEVLGLGSCSKVLKQTPEEIEQGLDPIETTTYYLVLDNKEIEDLRVVALGKWEQPKLHCTMGFSFKDVHGEKIKKGVDTIIYTVEDINNHLKKGKSFKA